MRFLPLLFALLLTTQSFAASIWHVQGKQEYYLFGTIHLLKPESYPLAKVYNRTLEKCDVLWLEADSNELNDASILQTLQQAMLLPKGQILRDQMSFAAYQQLELLADKANVSLTLLQELKPWAAANELTRVIFQQYGFTGDGLDVHLQNYAQAHDIPIKAFETFLWQLTMFDDLSQGYGDDFIEFSTAEMDDVEQSLNDLYGQWLTGDYQAMYIQAEFDDYPEVEAEMLAKRNAKWMAKLLSKDLGVVQCVAVGALHMAAEHGLINQFKKAGYQVTHVKN